MVTALARWFSRQGVDVAPFKAQNMSNNARVVDGGEIGVAQWLQALAAGVTPDVTMNPVLLKPEADTQSQVVVNGQVRHDLSSMPWRDRGSHLWPAMTNAFDELSSRHDLVLLEGAGSPAEINLEDLVNNRMIDYADASGLLVVDIDRGGAFAHLFGTWLLVPETTRDRIAGFVLNKFRGDASLLEPGPSMISERTGMRHAGTLPVLAHNLPDEEGATIRAGTSASSYTVGIVRYPYASNLDEFHLLGQIGEVRWITNPRHLRDCDLVILPGSKHVAADIGWLRAQQLDGAIIKRAEDDGPIIGICGGCMMLGEAINDDYGVEGGAVGLGLLSMTTDLEPTKLTRAVTVEFPRMRFPFEGLSGVVAFGYEIRNGRVKTESCELAPMLWGHHAILATTVHGLLEDPRVVEALCGARPQPVLEATFESLADAIDEHLDTNLLWELVEGSPQ
jgi:adenosylcobyric acid synthase